MQAMQARDLMQSATTEQSSPQRASAPASAVSLSAQAAKHAVHAVQTFTALAQVCQARCKTTCSCFRSFLSVNPAYCLQKDMQACTVCFAGIVLACLSSDAAVQQGHFCNSYRYCKVVCKWYSLSSIKLFLTWWVMTMWCTVPYTGHEHQKHECCTVTTKQLICCRCHCSRQGEGMS